MKEESKKKQRTASSGGKSYLFISYFFVMIFVALIGYMIYFNKHLAEEFQNNSYNTRSKSATQRILRGTIKAAGGEVLAETIVDEDGTEKRVYPYGREFAHVVGYASQGGAGLESAQETTLLTSNAFILDQIKRELNGEKKLGDTLVTTLDQDLQEAACNALGDRKGAIVAMDPQSGAVLAMVSKPDFDPEKLEDQNYFEKLTGDTNNSCLVNRASSGLYPPGSIFKVVTALSYFRQYGTIEDFTYKCKGEITVGEDTIHCYKNEKHGKLDFTQLFAHSCNAGFASVGLLLDKETFRATAEDLYFNTALEAPVKYRESRFSLTADAGDGLTMQTAIGQGDTLVTPLHMCMLASAICNNGALMKPYLADRVENEQGTLIHSFEKEKLSQIMTVREAILLQDMMKETVESGTATKLKKGSYESAGKTGTADYSENQKAPHSWFIGYASENDRQIAIAVIIEETGAGSSYAVPAAKKVFDRYF